MNNPIHCQGIVGIDVVDQPVIEIDELVGVGVRADPGYKIYIGVQVAWVFRDLLEIDSPEAVDRRHQYHAPSLFRGLTGHLR